jgi:hypothetical protein
MKIFLLISSLLIVTACSNSSSLSGAKPIKTSEKKDNLKIVLEENLKKRSIESMIYKVHSLLGELWIEAFNTNGNLSLFKKNEENTFNQIDLNFLKSYDIYINNKYIYSNNHYIIFYQKDNEDRNSDAGLAIIKDNQLVYNKLETESYINSYNLDNNQGIMAFRVERTSEESDNEFSLFWYDGQNVNSFNLSSDFKSISKPIHKDGNIYFIGRFDDGEIEESRFFSLNIQTRILEIIEEDIIDRNQWPDIEQISHWNNNIYFRTNVPTDSYLYAAIIELSSNGLQMVTDQYNYISDYMINDEGFLHLKSNNSEIIIYNLNEEEEPVAISFNNYFENFYKVLGDVFFTTYLYDNNQYNESVNIIIDGQSTSVFDLPPESRIRQTWDDGNDVYVLLNMDHGESVIRKINPESDSLEKVFFITEEDGFAKNTGYEIGELFSFNNHVCFEHYEYIDSNNEKESFSCYDGEKLTILFQENRANNEDYEHIENDPLISRGKMFFKTNRDRLFIIDKDLSITIKENMEMIDSLFLYDGSNLFFRDYSYSSIKKMKSDDTIEDLISPLFISDSVNNYRKIKNNLLFSALNQNEELKHYRLDEIGGVSEININQLNIEYNYNTSDFFAYYEDNNYKIHNILENNSIIIDSDSNLENLVVNGDNFWAIIYQFPYRRYIFKGSLSNGEVFPVEEDPNFSRTRIGRGFRGAGPENEEEYSDINLDPSDLISHKNHLYWIGNNKNNYRIIFRKNINTGKVEELFHPELNPRNYGAYDLILVGDKLYFKALANDIHIGSVLCELQLDEVTYNQFNFYKEEDMLPENFKALMGKGGPE